MTKFLQIALLIIGLMHAPLVKADESFVLGVDRPELYKPFLVGKRIGLVVNQASLSGGVHTIEKLLSYDLKVVKLFALEHGVRGLAGNGEQISDSIDEKSGIPIVSIYGDVKKPTPAKLAGVDVIVYDIQDVGVRFFTYISSLGLILEAAAEQHLPVVLFDRPNPNGDYVDGPILKPDCKSFVGAFPIPIVYGLTAGELGKMIHGEGWQNTAGLNLKVIGMKKYKRETIRAPEGVPSPALRTLTAMRMYPSLCLFEPTIMSIGHGTEHPFEQFGIAPEQIGPHSFTPKAKDGAKEPPSYDGQICHGEEFYSRGVENLPHFSTDFFSAALGKVKRRPFVTDRRFLELLVGDKRVTREILNGRPYNEVRLSLQSEIAEFMKKRRVYLMY